MVMSRFQLPMLVLPMLFSRSAMATHAARPAQSGGSLFCAVFAVVIIGSIIAAMAKGGSRAPRRHRRSWHGSDYPMHSSMLHTYDGAKTDSFDHHADSCSHDSGTCDCGGGDSGGGGD